MHSLRVNFTVSRLFSAGQDTLREHHLLQAALFRFCPCPRYMRLPSYSKEGFRLATAKQESDLQKYNIICDL